MRKANIKICAEKPTVNKIIEAAIPLFATKGLACVSVKELADAAGVNIALISYYFGGKDNLYAFILERQLSLLGDAIDSISQEETSPVMKIRRFADILLAAYKQSPYIDQLFFMEILNPTKYFDSLVKTAAIRLHIFLQDCIKQAVETGEFRPGIDPKFAAISLMKILNVSFTSLHFCKELLAGECKEDIADRYMAHALEIYLHGVLNES